MKTHLLFAGVVLAAVATACSAEQIDSSVAPSLDDSLDVQDEGYTYGGWSMYPSAWEYDGVVTAWQYFERSYGDSTRGGGACVVFYRSANPSSCTSDSACLSAAQSQFGSSAYGYCFAGVCWSRPGSQADYCTLGANRAPGQYVAPTVSSSAPTDHAYPAVLGCMTKAAGPNTACGGTDGSLYMRTVGATASPW